MSTKKTTAEFVADARKVHGDRYDYSQVRYVGSRDKVQIVCSVHGVFEQTPNTHLQGNGCWDCGGSKPGTKEEFIAAAKQTHGGLYDYSKVAYVNNNKTKVQIVCRVHGTFQQRPNSHLRGDGCPRCGIEKKSEERRHTKEMFISAARIIHGQRYDYSLVKYTNCRTKVQIVCPDHGVFEQAPNTHIYQGSGCAKCRDKRTADTNRFTKDDFVQIAKRAHGDIYDYSQVEYVDSRTKVQVVCADHGVFEQLPADHQRGIGCPKCGHEKAGISNRYTEEDFIAAARLIHGPKYDYSQVEYVRSQVKVRIICQNHGVFEQTPNEHLSGSNCPSCWESKGEKAVAEFLGGAGMAYEREKRFDTCRNILPLPFDFYVPSLNTLIEFHGVQHFEPVPGWGGVEIFWGVQDRDLIKRDWAAENGYNLIEIRYDDDVDAVLSERLCGAPQTNLTISERKPRTSGRGKRA